MELAHAFRRGLQLLLALLPAVASGAEDLLIASAVSLREPMLDIAARYAESHPAVRLRHSFGGSNLLAAQVRAGAPVDVLVAADARIVEALVAEGLIATGERREIARNALVVVCAADAEIELAGPEDLERPEIARIAVPERAVPVGRYAREWLEGRGQLARLLPKLIPTEHARATLAAVDGGHATAAIVYASDARLARSARVAFDVPAHEQPTIRYVAAAVRGSPPEARGFLAFLGGEEARRALVAAGLEPPGAQP